MRWELLKVALHAIDRAEYARCELCGAANHKADHTVFCCTHPLIIQAMDNADAELAKLNPDLLPEHIRMGIATAMSLFSSTAFLGRPLVNP